MSLVEICVIPAGRISERDRNYDPVQGSYHALWREYELLDSPISLMNVMHRILEHYFIQLCGYDSAAMSTKVLEAVKKKIDEESSGMGQITRNTIWQGPCSPISGIQSLLMKGCTLSMKASTATSTGMCST